MRIVNFGVRDDELGYFARFAKEIGVECFTTSKPLNQATAYLLKGMDGVTDITSRCYGQAVYQLMQDYGIKFFSLRQAGYDGLDCDLGQQFGVRFARVPDYSPNAISEYSVGLALMLLRKMNITAVRSKQNDYRLDGLNGREIRDCTVGILGTGHIGLAAARAFQGFGGRVIAYDVEPREEERKWLTYIDQIDDFFNQVDLLGIYMPFNSTNYHVINQQTITKMPDRAVIINVARGEHINHRDLYAALKSGKIAGAALDVYEGERAFFHQDFSIKLIEDDLFRQLSALPNVIITPHNAFNTDHAVRNMVKISLENIINMSKSNKIKNEIL